MKAEFNQIKCGEIFWYDFGKFIINCDYCLETFNTGTDAYEHINQHFLNDKDDNIDETELFDLKDNIICMEYTVQETDVVALETGFLKELEIVQEDNIYSNEDWFNENDSKLTNSYVELPTKGTKVKKQKKEINKLLGWGPHITYRTNVLCDICGKCTIKGKMLDHLRTHTNLKEFSCDICNKAFNTKTTLKSHKMIHSSFKRFGCEYCGWRCHYQANLQSHMRQHTGEKPFKCKMCDKHFAQQYGLKLHMQMHEGRKSYLCDVCNIYVSYSTLLKHRLRHVQNRRYKCTQCDSAFYASTDLRYHMRTHTGERPYTCEICNKSFARRSVYRQHAILHTGKKPHKCRHCDATFAQRAGRRSHERSVHKEHEKTLQLS